MEELKKLYKAKVQKVAKFENSTKIPLIYKNLIPFIFIIIAITVSIGIYLGKDRILSLNKALNYKCYLNVNLRNGNSQVYLDSKQIGSTPINNYWVSCESHQVKIEKEENNTNFYWKFDRNVEFPKNSIVTLNLNLGPNETSSEVQIFTEEKSEQLEVFVFSNPSEASVFIDGNLIGITPQKINNIEPGEHTIILVKDGYISNEKKIYISENRKIKIVNYLMASPIEYEQ